MGVTCICSLFQDMKHLNWLVHMYIYINIHLSTKYVIRYKGICWLVLSGSLLNFFGESVLNIF